VRVVGLDLSYSRTGFACIENSHLTLDNFKTKPGPLIPRTSEIVGWVLSRLVHPVDLVVVERAVFGGHRASMLGGLSAAVLVAIYEKFPSCSILLIPPPTLKRWAGVKGTKRSLMVQAFRVECPEIKACHDEVDAYFLATLGWSYCLKRAGLSIVPRADDILFSRKLIKTGAPKGYALRYGDYFYEGRNHGIPTQS